MKRFGWLANLAIVTAQEIKQLPAEEKIRIMEVIWDDLRERFEGSELSQALKDLLDSRRARVRTGEAQLLDWDTAKRNIGRQ